MTTPPLETSPETRQSAGQAGGQAPLPPLKTPVYFRASACTLDALTYIQERMNCDKTAAIELGIAQLAAYLKADVYTPGVGEGQTNER